MGSIFSFPLIILLPDRPGSTRRFDEQADGNNVTNAASFEIPPAVIGGTTINMTAAKGSYSGGLTEYYFEEITGNPGGDHSGWQSSPYYSDGGLLPNNQYAYRVISRDPVQGTSEPSSPFGATTQEPEPWKNDLDYGAYYGYQAWHRGPEDAWSHWFDGGIPDAEHMSGDNWPDFSEYPLLYPTQLLYPDGSVVSVYSCNDYETIDVHIRWMKEYGLKGCFLQRQQLNIHNSITLEQMDRKAIHVRRACEKYGIKFCMMPCNNDKSVTGLGQEYIDNIIADWKHCVDDLKITESPMYMHQDGKPVIGFWGLGFANRQMTPEQANQILDSFQNPSESKYRVYVMGGVPNDWRTKTKVGFMPVYERLDMISPWRPIFYDPYNQAWIDRMAGDKAFCDTRGIDYNPTVSPGASVAYQNFDPDLRNKNPRDGGYYLWKQVYEVCKLKNKFMYVAMFDEIDEGTAMYKMAETQDDCPVVDPLLVPLNEDGYDLPSDWYLRLGTELQKMLEGSIPLDVNLPIRPVHAILLPEPPVKDNLRVYPNPTGNLINVEGGGPDTRFIVYSITGVKVMESNLIEWVADISGLPPGIYIISINKKSTRFVRVK
ncbi:MAG: T9SS type A sorting domain-containing protein [Bacteroidales bacterium]|nr:T9SS type A sorting domain-containing protein [Bacteroidales bacterium]